MNLREAERIAALSYEVDLALELLDDEDDLEVLWATIRDDLPHVCDRLLEDAARASAVLEEERERIRDEDQDWERDHLRRLHDASDDDS